MTKKERVGRILQFFREQMADADTELEFASVFQLLVAVVLSAQCTDKRVNMVTPALFKAYPDAFRMAEADEGELLEYIKSVSYPNAKARHLSALSKRLVCEYGGEVPSEMDDLLTLPGVGRKTANVMLSVAFGRNAIAVDTHVFRVSHRLGLVSKSDDTPLKVERALMRVIPIDEVSRAHHWLLLHGRYVCTSQRPKCGSCPLATWCPGKGKQMERGRKS